MCRTHYFKVITTAATSGLAGNLLCKGTLKSDSGDEEHDLSSLFSKTLEVFKNEFSWHKVHREVPKPRIINELKLKEEYQAPKYPVVLCHGLSGFDKLILIPSFHVLSEMLNGRKVNHYLVTEDHGGVAIEYWAGIKDALESKGSTVMVAKVPGFGSIEDRANVLNSYIINAVGRLRRQSKSEVYNIDEKEETDYTFKDNKEKVKVNLIAHSMGGLDCRYLISAIENKNFEVVSLTTVTTPHRGSEVADYVVDLVNKAPQKIQLPPSIYQLTTNHMREFNEKVKDDSNVRYFSYGAEFKPQWYNVFFTSWNIINSRAGPNDGMVSVESAKWGIYLGTLVNVDHLDLINWTNSLKKIAGQVTGGTPQIDILALYLEIADNLAKQGL